MFACLQRKYLPSTYHTPSFAMGLWLAPSLKQWRGQWDSRYKYSYASISSSSTIKLRQSSLNNNVHCTRRTLITTHKVHFRSLPAYSPWLAGHCLELMDFPSCQSAASWHWAFLCSQHGNSVEDESLSFRDTFLTLFFNSHVIIINSIV